MLPGRAGNSGQKQEDQGQKGPCHIVSSKMFRRRGIFPPSSGTFPAPPGNGATPAVHRKTDTKEKCIRSMAGPPHRQRLSCAEYGKRGAMSSARYRPCPQPAGEPAPYPIRHPGTLPHHCRSQEGRPSPSGFPQARLLPQSPRIPGRGRRPQMQEPAALLSRLC